MPDAPVTSFETNLPQGPHSALTTNLPAKANFSLCGQKLAMPTTLTAQNGAVIEQQHEDRTEGCGAVKSARAKKLTRAQKLAPCPAHMSQTLQACQEQARSNANDKRTPLHQPGARRLPA